MNIRHTLLLCLCLVGLTATRAQNTFTVSPEAKVIKYNPMIFGHFIEHFDTQVYGGLFDPGSRFADEDGFRTDVIEALKEIKVPIVRWPGGCFVSAYHWKYGIGKDRQPVYDKAWHVEDPNTFGTDEYVKWCRKVGCEPYICTNAGTGSPEEMSDWVEYCNLNVGQWGRQRIANGYPEPHNVKYWSVGNENWGGHEIGAKTVEEWGPLVRESSKLMLSVDQNLKLFAAATSNRDWSLPLLKAAGYLLDYISIHGYWDPLWEHNNVSPYLKCMMRSDLPEQDIKRTIDLLEEAGFGGGKVKIAYDEWNLRGWHHPVLGNFRAGFDLEARRKNDIAATYTMADALFSACFLNACLRHSDIVDIACFSPIVNTRGAIFVHPDGIVKRTTYYVFQMYTSLLQPYVLPITTTTELLNHEDDCTEMIDLILTTNEDRTQYALVAVNKSADKETPLRIDFQQIGRKAVKQLTGKVLKGSSPDDYNEIGHENRVLPEDAKFTVKDGTVKLPPHSLSIINL